MMYREIYTLFALLFSFIHDIQGYYWFNPDYLFYFYQCWERFGTWFDLLQRTPYVITVKIYIYYFPLWLWSPLLSLYNWHYFITINVPNYYIVWLIVNNSHYSTRHSYLREFQRRIIITLVQIWTTSQSSIVQVNSTHLLILFAQFLW